MLELAVVVPTFNERDNILELVTRLEVALRGIVWEAVFVDDDSPDGTADVVRQLSLALPHIRCVQRIGRRGLSRAVVEGMLATAAPVLAVIDADMQHDETRLPVMFELLQREQLDVVVGTRYANGGSVGAWDERRARMSRLATKLSRIIVKDSLSDPMSGFFMIRRAAFSDAARRLSGEGFKILLDLFASSPKQLTFAEVPYTFRPRHAGESKLDSAVLWEYLLLIVDKSVGHIVPARFVLFSLVGATGVVIHFTALWAMYRVGGQEFVTSQILATGLAMTSNYFLNNAITYRDKRRRGLDLFKGLLSFYVICGIGVIGNVGIANFVFMRNQSWLLAGGAGALVGTVWNYAASSIFTWGRRKV